jgi:hypothetical protein
LRISLRGALEPTGQTTITWVYPRSGLNASATTRVEARRVGLVEIDHG